MVVVVVLVVVVVAVVKVLVELLGGVDGFIKKEMSH